MHSRPTILLFALALAACDGGNGDGDGGAGAPDGTVRADGSTTPADGSTTGTDGSAGDSAAVDLDAGIGDWDGSVSGGIVPCQGHIYLCGNGLDDDSDGLTDDSDPDCLGPCDNNEGGFYLGIPGGDSSPCRLDCYFDQDQGPGNDQCQWNARCDPLHPDPDPLCLRPPSDRECPATQVTACGEFCGPLVPNGCDCFGCCQLPAGPGGADMYVFIGSVDDSGVASCGLDSLEGCRPCTPVDACLNACGRCELCLGRSFEDLPDDCFPPPAPVDAGTLPDGGVPPPPPDGGGPVIDICSDPTRQDCGAPGLPACPDGYFCVTGCCTFFG